MPRHQSFCIGLLSVVIVVSLLGCGKSSPDRSDRGSSPVLGGEDRFLASGLTGLHSSKPSEKLFVPLSSLPSATRDNEQYQTEEMPAWLANALDDPDPRMRIQALEAWAKHPGETLDPLTFALVDPDEAVRGRAQELLEEALARR
jgi:hypothetical protein